jgi:hypothetical protein
MRDEERAVTYGEIIVDKHNLISRSEVATGNEIVTVPQYNIKLNSLLENYF